MSLKTDYYVDHLDLRSAQLLVEQLHYSGGGSNTGTVVHGLFKRGGRAHGAAWWIPPTKSAALATYPENWQGVLALTRFVIDPDCPKNAASFLLGASMRMIDRNKWPCLVTYADEMMGHVGTIYKATNWQYVGLTKPQKCYFMGDRMVSRKAGPVTRTHQQMLDMGAELRGSFAKHKFIHVKSP